MLAKLEKEIPNMKLRLLGLRCTNLVSTKKVDINFFGAASQSRSAAGRKPDAMTEQQIGAEEAFEQAARQERQDDINELEQLSQEISDTEQTNKGGDPVILSQSERQPEFWNCPICSRPQVAEDKAFNDHVDYCLSRETIKEAVQCTTDESPVVIANAPKVIGRKRKATKESSHEPQDPRQRRLFFT
jgi:DNA polymerase kappa